MKAPKRPTAITQMRAVRAVVRELRSVERDAALPGDVAARLAATLVHAFSLSISDAQTRDPQRIATGAA